MIVTKDSNGVIISKINYINDSIRDGLTRLYFDNGVIGDEINYKNGLKEGWWLHFYQNSTLQSKRMYKGGIQDGPAYFYYEDGKLEHKEFWYQGQVFGGSYWYYKNGLLENYTSFDFEGNKRYKVEYDSVGNKTRDEGKLIGQVASNSVYDKKKKVADSILANELFYGHVSVANPPYTIVKVFMGGVYGNRMTDSIELPIINYLASFKRIYTKKGRHPLLFIGEMRDTTGILLKRDSFKVDVIVR